MRDTYYQSVGNPLQSERLPVSRPDIEFLAYVPSVRERYRQTASCFCMAAVVALAVLIVSRPPGWSWLEPYDLLFAIPTLLVGSVVSISRQRLQPLLHPCCLTAVALLSLNHRVPWSGRVAIVAVILLLFIYAFGRHFAALLTASPVRRDVAALFRWRFQTQLLSSACLVSGLLSAALLTNWVVLKLAILTLPCVVLAPLASTRTRRWRPLMENALLSWFTYDAPQRPGLLHCPIGSSTDRIGLTVLITALTAMVLVHWDGSPVGWVVAQAKVQHQSVFEELQAEQATVLEHVRFGGFPWIVAFVSIALLPVLLPWAVALPLTLPVLADAMRLREEAQASSNSETILSDLRRSSDLVERESIYLGRVVADGSPALVPRTVFQEHAHGLGDSGAGKTSLFLCPLIEQLVRGGDCSVITLDLKADTLEVLASMQAVQDMAHRERGVRMPLKVFSNQAKHTFAFNPMTQPFWAQFDLLTRTDILCGATGLTYGTDYGAGYYSSANGAILYHTLRTYPEITTFRELVEAIGTVITTAKNRDLNPEIRKAGVHVQEVMKRLAACEPLNVTASSGHSAEVMDHGIDLTQVFREPQLLYFHLSATLSPSGAREIARLVNYLLLAAATQTERKHPVFLVIDEFQRMVASNLEFMLQLARSMGVGVILANQSMADLNKGTTNLIPAIEANCRLRQWFAVSSSEDQQRLIETSGLAIDYERSHSVTTNADGRQSVSHSATEKVVSRITKNDVLLTSDHPFQSILRLSRGAGVRPVWRLPRHHRIPVPHLAAGIQPPSQAALAQELAGSFLSGQIGATTQATAAAAQLQAAGPQWSEEVIGAAATPLSEADEASLAAVFDALKQTTPAPSPRRRRTRS